MIWSDNNKLILYINILTEKCVFCHKNAIYSSDEKGFLPPYIKYNREKLLNPLPKNVKPDSIFYHPQCVSFWYFRLYLFFYYYCFIEIKNSRINIIYNK